MRAPSASATRASVPRRTPPSNSTGSAPPTASTTSGSASRLATAPSSCRPPWLDTTIPSTPCSTARVASSAVRMPLSTIGRLVCAPSQARSAQVTVWSNDWAACSAIAEWPVSLWWDAAMTGRRRC